MNSVPIMLAHPDHLPAHLRAPADLNGVDGTVVEKAEHWMDLWVPDDPAAHAADYDQFPAEVLAIQLRARRHGFDWVRFDTGTEYVNDLRIYYPVKEAGQ